MAIDFDALQELVGDAKTEADQATVAETVLGEVNQHLATVQAQVSEAIEVAQRERAEATAKLQQIIDLIQAGL